MNTAKVVEELLGRVSAAVPPGLDKARADLEKNLRATVGATLARMDLVTREEFDVQAAVLARTRAKLEVLQRRVDELERALDQPGPGIKEPS